MCTPVGVPELKLVFGRVFLLLTADWLVADCWRGFSISSPVTDFYHLIIWTSYFRAKYVWVVDLAGFRTQSSIL